MKNVADLLDYEKSYGPLLYGGKPFLFTHGKGATLHTSNDQEYLDFVQGHGVGNIGHSHPKFIKALTEQIEKVIVLHSAFPNEQRALLLKKLADITPSQLTNTFLSNSGTEAVETAMKLMIASHRDIKKPHIIAMKRGFHGRTLGSLSLTFGKLYRSAFEGAMGIDVSFASFGDIDSVKSLINENTIGIITEIIQGEGGIHIAPQEFPQQLREICDNKGLTLVFDEIQSGVGRTGKFFAFEHYNVVPDIVTVAKSIAGGVPMGATIATNDVFSSLKRGEHASTFGGNPLSAAAANATIDIIYEENLMENATRIGTQFTQTISQWREEDPKLNKMIKEHRGLGAMQGIQVMGKAGKYIKNAFDNNLLLLNAGMTVMRALPPLVATKEQVDSALNIIKNSLFI